MNIQKDSIAICVVADFKYLKKNFSRLLKQIRYIGKFDGEIILITSLLSPTFLLKNINKKNKIKVLRFRKIKFDLETNKILSTLSQGSNRHVNKNFQWQKLFLFHTKLKNWKYIFYLDINMNIHHDLRPLLQIKPKNKLFARADGYPNYEWELNTQFDKTNKLFKTLSNEFDLSIKNYFQTGVMYFDTDLINTNTVKEILNLVKKFPISITNEQGILNIYFIYIKNSYEELVHEVSGKISYFYWMLEKKDVIITKATQKQYK